MAHLHTATDPQGTVLFGADTPAEFRRLLCNWLDAHPTAGLIEHESHQHPARAFPFTAWRRVWNETRGSMHTTRADAVRALTKE